MSDRKPSQYSDDRFDDEDDVLRTSPRKSGFPVWAIVLLCALPIVAVLVVGGGAIAMFRVSRTADVQQNEAQVRIIADTKMDMAVRAPAVVEDAKKPSPKTQEMVQILKADIAAFEVHLYTFAGEPDADKIQVNLVTDPKKIPAKAKDVFPISHEQANALIDYMADSGMFDRWTIPPAGIAAPGWYFAVARRSTANPDKYWWYGWGHRLDVKPATVGVVQHLTKSLEGDAKLAVEGFRKGVEKTKQ